MWSCIIIQPIFHILFSLTVPVGYRANIYMSQAVYQIMYCTGWGCKLYAKSKQINVKLHGILWQVCMDLAYNLQVQLVQYMIWYTTSYIYIRLIAGETE